MTATLAFYCVADERYFLGAVGMINSLRLQGHHDPVYLLDCGLRARQRELLAAHVEIVDPPRTAASPHLLKTVAPLAHPAETMVLLDTDIVVTRPLAELIEPAAEGAIVAIRDNVQRWFAQWGPLLELGETRPGPYVSSGLVALDGELGAETLRLMDASQDRVDFARTYWRGNDPDYPFLYADQDVLNGVLATSVDPGRLVVLDERLSAVTPFAGLEPIDESSLRCAYPDGAEPLVAHFILPSKPWQRPMYHGVYSELLKRALVGPGLAIELPTELVPLRFRDGAAAGFERGRIHARDRLGWRVREILPQALLDRLDDSRRERAAAR
ncbi:MAG: hypothetical protein ACR2OC_10235 [Solirubrobacterales bacterium]